MLYIWSRDLGVLLEFRGIGAGTTEGTLYFLWGWSATAIWEVEDLPVVWLVRACCILFWLKVLSCNIIRDKRILRRVALEAVKHGRWSWLKKMVSCCNEFSWQEVCVEQVKDMPEAELKGMLESVAWQRVKEEWSKYLEKKPKLLMIRRMVEYGRSLLVQL